MNKSDFIYRRIDSRNFHCIFWITFDVSVHLTPLNVPHFRNSINSVIYERKHKVRVLIFLVRMQGTILVPAKSDFFTAFLENIKCIHVFNIK